MKEYTITAVEYARVEDFNNAMIYSGYYGEGITKITYTINVLKSGEDIVIVDTGYDLGDREAVEHARAENHQFYQKPTDMLRKVGVDPEKVKHVILTHAHWDHMGGVHFFPNATFYLQKEELLNWIAVLSMEPEYGILKNPMAYQNVEECVALIKENRLRLLDGDVDQLFSGIDIKVARFGHSFAQNIVCVNTREGKYLLTGDTAYVKENIVGVNGNHVSLPNGYAIGSTFNTIGTMQQILKMVHQDIHKVIVGHDNHVWDEYESKLFDDNLHVAYIVK